jgi:hypothetical protein
MAAFYPNTSSTSPRAAATARAASRRIAARAAGRFASTALAFAAAAAAMACAQTAYAGLGAAPMETPNGATVSTLSPAAAHGVAASQAAQLAAQASAASPSSATSPYTVRQTTLTGGIVVREYVSQSGAVFGVAWRGPQPPDLSALLGSYFPQYVAGVKASHAAGIVHGPGIVEQPGLVVHSGGHMGAFSGQAWLPQDLPAGVSAADIQ